MITQDKLLYESKKIWDQTLQIGQKNLTQAIIDFFPQEIKTALDVGCGDGKLTSAIIAATKCPIIGLDASREALSRCSFNTIHADATNLPFQDNEFDLILTMDMMEHLPKHMEDMVWKQLFRISKSWVMVAVPFREELLDATAKCSHCEQLYHVNWHMRSYDWPELVSRCPDSHEIDKIILTGESWNPYSIFETRFRRKILNEWSGWSDAFCPHCNHPGACPDTVNPLPPLTASALGSVIYTERLKVPDFRSHSEILVIYRRKSITQTHKNHFINKANLIDSKANELIFDETQIESNLVPYPSIARAVRSIDKDIIIQFPAYSSYDFLEIKTIQDEAALRLSLEDGLGIVYSEQLNIKSRGTHFISLKRKTTPSYYGILVRINSTKAIKSIQLGENHLIRILKNPADTQCSYYSTKTNQIPIYLQVTSPCYFSNNMLTQTNSSQTNWINLFKQIESLVQKERDGLQAQNQDLILERDGLQAQNQDLILERDGLQAQNQDLILERDGLQAQNYTLLSEVYAFNNRLEVRITNKIIKLLKKIKRIFIK
ncbi:class I SAM-dependent methyltransferase [Legionella nagasakiensis]|uniref:class I SAM-dependent methyltransferase n=1 Tax=Legionella nagasakiensis TaxID=535290 RepID=UPI0010544EBC|nr:class I SAM-dependent methyltransferase [Legionella nagasakiensis]